MWSFNRGTIKTKVKSPFRDILSAFPQHWDLYIKLKREKPLKVYFWRSSDNEIFKLNKARNTLNIYFQ